MECASNKQEKRFKLSYYSEGTSNMEVSVRFNPQELEEAGIVMNERKKLHPSCNGDYFIVKSEEGKGRHPKDVSKNSTGWAFSVDQSFADAHPNGIYSFTIVDDRDGKAIRIGSFVEPLSERETKTEDCMEQKIEYNNHFHFDDDAYYIAASPSYGAKNTPYRIPQINISSLKINDKSVTIETKDGKKFHAHNPPDYFNAKLEAIKR